MSNSASSSSSHFKIENDAVLFQLYHKTKHSNTMNVVCEISDEIGAAFFDDEKQDWVVPSDIVGLGTKKSKSVKIRFHPSVLSKSKKDKKLRMAACTSSLKYLDLLLDDSEWTRRTDQDDKLFDVQLKNLTHAMNEMDKMIDFHNSRMMLTFLPNEHFDDFVKTISCKSVANHLVTKITNDDDCQTVEMVFEKDGYSRNIVKMQLDSGYLQLSQQDTPSVLDVSKSSVSWVLERSDDDINHSPAKPSQKLDCSIYVEGVEEEAVVYSPCFTICHLTERLSSSLQMPGTPVSQSNTLSRVPQNFSADAIIALDKSESTHLSKFIYNITTTPLRVNCDFDSSTIPQTEAELSWSPTDSIDSGVSLSPTQSIDDVCYSPLRERSCSESGTFNSNHVKGILKWPRSYRNQFSRSYSECHEDGKISPIYFNASPFFEDEEDIFHESDEDTENLPAAPRRKSVSFSDRIEKRLFNSTTSIDSQKRKTQKKNEKKKKREERNSMTTDDDHTDGEDHAAFVRGMNRHATV